MTDDYIRRSDEMRYITAKQKELGIDPSIIVLSNESLAALHYALSQRQTDGEQYVPQKDFIANCKYHHLKGMDAWLDDMLVEMKKATNTTDLSDAQSAKQYLDTAERLESPHIASPFIGR